MFSIHHGSSNFSNYDQFVKRSIKHNRVHFQLFKALVTLKLKILKSYSNSCSSKPVWLAFFFRIQTQIIWEFFFLCLGLYGDQHCSVTNILQNIWILYLWVKYSFNSGVFHVLFFTKCSAYYTLFDFGCSIYHSDIIYQIVVVCCITWSLKWLVIF